MGIITLGGIKISRDSPTIRVKIANNLDDISTAKLYLKRVGEYYEFAEYPPTLEGDDYLEFTFDELLFSKLPGKYLARVAITERDITEFYIVYVDNVTITVTAG